jgi:hypothetical protein|tara:strand:- start:1171 stop:1572 length:402 start_codon:yes stop_codon:yes gene_type:complete
MIDPKKKIRQVLFSIYPLSYRIKITEPDKHFMDKKLFISVMQSLKQIEERRDFMQEEIGMDMTAYEEQFFTVIENLMKMHFNKEQLALIQMYLYQLVPDKEWDGTITIEKNKQDKVVPFKLPEDVWNVVNSFT